MLLRAAAVIGIMMRAAVGRCRLVGAVGIGDFITFVKAFLFGTRQFVVLIAVIGIVGNNRGSG